MSFMDELYPVVYTTKMLSKRILLTHSFGMHASSYAIDT